VGVAEHKGVAAGLHLRSGPHTPGQAFVANIDTAA
jgi:hypothetical protein